MLTGNSENVNDYLNFRHTKKIQINSLRKQDIKINVFDLDELIEIPSFKFKRVKKENLPGIG